MSTDPRVSVTCIFLDEAKYLQEAVESVLQQRDVTFELMLVDDGSTDGGSEIARDYARRFPSVVRYVEHPDHANRGTSASRNAGLALSRGEFVTFLDGDDVWRPTKLAEQVRLLDLLPEVGMVCGAANYWRSWSGGEDEVILTGHLADCTSRPPETSLNLYPLGKLPAPCDALIRRSLVDAIGGHVNAFRGLYDDQAFYSKIYLAAPVHFSGKVWVDYRQHPESCCATFTRDEYVSVRRDFLQWFADYVERAQVSEKARITRAIQRAMWILDHPRAARLTKPAYRALGRFAPRLPERAR